MNTKKEPHFEALDVNGAANWNMLQPLAVFIAKEFKNIPIEEIRCFLAES